MPNPTVEGSGRGPARDRDGAKARQLSDSDATRTAAIQIIRSFLAGGEVPGRVKDAWKHVENALSPSSAIDAYQTREALEDLRKDIAHLKGLLREQQSEPKKPTTYAEAARARGGAGWEGPEGDITPLGRLHNQRDSNGRS